MMDATVDRLLAAGLVYGPEYHGGLSDHHPMGLVALARLREVAPLPADLLERWSDAYRGRLDAPAPFPDRHGFGRALSGGDPHAIARAALERHGRGLPGAAGHGFLRVYFALEAEPLVSPAVFRAELARGLDYFVENGAPLGPDGDGGTLELIPALAAAPPLADDTRAGLAELRFITTRQEAAARDPSFAAAVASVRADFSFGDALAGLAALGAANPDFTLLHALTTGQALLGVEDLLPGLDAAALKRGWVAFVTAAWLVQRLSPPPPAPPDAPDLGPAWVRLGATTDDHAPKAAFALERLHRRFGRPAFLAALARYVEAYG